MIRRISTPVFVIYLIYLAAIAMTTALLVFWVLVVQRYASEINQLMSRLSVEWGHFHWFVQTSGAGLFFLVIVALTYLLAVTLSERRYSQKREELLASVTHELKTPVAAIKLHAQTLQHEDLAPADLRTSIGFILAEAERVGGLVDELLESSRLLTSRTRLDLQPISLREFFRDYQDAVRGRFDLRRIDLTFEVHTRSAVMATSEALRRIMDNLIDNALRFTGAGGRVLCQVRDGANGPEIVVADTGIGIKARDLDRIFDRFYRPEQPLDRRRRGSGLGLSIVRELVRDLRGRVRAISNEDQPGARFEIRLPEARTDQVAEEA